MASPGATETKTGFSNLGRITREEIPYGDRQQVAYYESYDDSPQWWHVAGITRKQAPSNRTPSSATAFTPRLLGVGLDGSGIGQAEVAALTPNICACRNINRLLWDPADSATTIATGTITRARSSPKRSPDIFFSLLGKVAGPEQVEALRSSSRPREIRRRVYSPTISRDDPALPQQDYWRGKVWPPIIGCLPRPEDLRMGSRSAAVGRHERQMFLKAWREKRMPRELPCHHGRRRASDPHYTWGALMALLRSRN